MIDIHRLLKGYGVHNRDWFIDGAKLWNSTEYADCVSAISFCRLPRKLGEQQYSGLSPSYCVHYRRFREISTVHLTG